VNKYNQQQTGVRIRRARSNPRPPFSMSFPSVRASAGSIKAGPGQVAGGWQVAGILTYNNSQPLAITQTGESFMNGTNRPNINPSVPLWSGNYSQIPLFFEGKIPAPLLFSTNAWSNTGSEYVLGNANRNYNSVRGPWYPVENLSAKKLFHITEGTSFTLRMDYFNAFNRVQAPFPTTRRSAPPTSARSPASSRPPTARDRPSSSTTSNYNHEGIEETVADYDFLNKPASGGSIGRSTAAQQCEPNSVSCGRQYMWRHREEQGCRQYVRRSSIPTGRTPGSLKEQN
jgi:hypothetical protein